MNLRELNKVEIINFDEIIKKHQNELQHVPFPTKHMATDYERLCLGALGLEFDTGSDIVEFGTWRGLTTTYLANLFSYKTIYTIDLSKEKATENGINPIQASELLPFDEVGCEVIWSKCNNVRQIINDSFNVNLLLHCKPESVDMAFIDGNHTLKYVEHDCNEAMKVLKKDGILVLHDFSMDIELNLNDLEHNVGPSIYVSQNLDKNWKHIQNTAIAYRKI